ncbi:glycosyltransferase [Catalinimonas niigatensis]|uniref:glycosyltransferase n=1 Tax=Catalinimonas niigatensis TaxID=1397264 RepID=UPI00266711D1|nr:glycosyltransferase [Catalinimonas niigatensis]WPP53326.1 glycosyltransferase [Catalinimonas niigatensis]
MKDPQRVKVLFIIPNLDRGGSEKVFYHILKYIDKQKFDITAAVVTRPGIYYDLLPENIHKELLGAKKVKYSFLPIIRLIRTYQPDIIFTFNVNHLNLIIIPLLKLLFYRGKLITRESNIMSVVNAKKGKLKPFVDFAYRLLYKRVDTVICQSKYMKQDLLEKYNIRHSQITLINNPFIFEDIINSSNADKLRLSPSTYNLLAVGRLTYQKGFDLLIKALTYVKVDFHLTIIGGETFEHPEYKEHLYALVDQLRLSDKVTFQGFEKNPYPFMKQANVLVLPSRHEGFPNVALEAMALGKSVIAFASPGGQNDLIVNGKNGWLVEFGNLEELAQVISRQAHTTLDEQTIINIVKNDYDISSVIRKYEKLLSSIVNPK